MTRINCVPVQELSTKHLVAEYRELPRVFRLAEKAWSAGRKVHQPEDYVLGTGHVSFFYTRLGWCKKRFHELRNEMLQRGYKPNYADVPPCTIADSCFWQDWQPGVLALETNRQRIADRQKKSP